MMKRYAPGEIIDGKVKMVEREDGDFVLAVRHEQAVAAAVAAERRRVWDSVTDMIRAQKMDAHKWDFLVDVRTTLFPLGEPQPTNTAGPSAIELLKDLADLQNGPPLEQHRKEWEETMDKVYKCLSEHGL